MLEVDFFTPIEFNDKNRTFTQSLLQLTDSYFYLGGKKAVVISTNQKDNYEEVMLREGSPSFITTALKVASYLTLVLPVLILVLKAVLRSLYDFYIIEPKKEVRIKTDNLFRSPAVEAKKQDQPQPLIPFPQSPVPQVVAPLPFIFTPPPKVVTPPLPPLPHIFDKQLDPASPLLKDVPASMFFKSDPDTQSKLKLAATFGTDPIGLFGDQILDQNFLFIPLSFWIKQDLNHYNSAINLKVMNDPERAGIKAIINERIKALQGEFQLIERLNRKNCDLRIKDLLPAWPKSKLKLELIMDDEIGLLKTSSIDSFGSEIVWETIGRRILELGQKQTAVSLPANPAKNEIGSILLVDLVKLKADQIHACVDAIPPLALLLIEKRELQKIQIDRLSANQLDLLLKAIFYDHNSGKIHYFIEHLTSSQIESLIPLLKDKKHLKNLTVGQILQLDFSKMDQDLFDNIFYSNSKTAKVFPELDISIIYQLSSFFSKGHWKLIGEKHKDVFDILKIDQAKREVAFDAIYTTYDASASKLLPKLPLDTIYELAPYFSKEHWQRMGDAHKVALDFAKIDPKRREFAFIQMFTTYDDETKKLLPKLPLDKIYELAPYFSKEHWQKMGDAHKVALDFSRIDPNGRKFAFNQMFTTYDDEAKKLLPKLPLDKIYELAPYFSKEHWQRMGDAHKVALDFSKIDPALKQWAFNQIFTTYDAETSNLLPKLTLDKIYELAPYFSTVHWKNIKESDVLSFDFSRIEENKRKVALQAIFDTYGGNNSPAARLLPQLDKAQKDFIRPYLTREAAKFL